MRVCSAALLRAGEPVVRGDEGGVGDWTGRDEGDDGEGAGKRLAIRKKERA